MKKEVLALYANMATVPKKNNLYFFFMLEKRRNPFIMQVSSAFAKGPPHNATERKADALNDT